MTRSSDVALGLCAAAASTLVVLTGADVLAQPVSVTAGVTVRALSGTFGSAQTTTLVYVPANLRVETGRLEASFFFPYLNIMDGTVALSQGGFVPMQGSLTGAPGAGMPMGATGSGMMSGGMMSGTGGSSGASPDSFLTNQSGMGDVVGTVGYRVVDNALSGVQVLMGTRLKIPTASSTRGLGTGKTDVGAFAAIRKQFDRTWVTVEGGYLRVGDPAGIDLRDAAFWSLGAGRGLSPRASLLVSATGNTAILPEFGAPLELGAGLGIRAGDRLFFRILPSAGLTDASPRFALTVGLSQRLLER